MRACVMINSVTKDELPLANLNRLSGIWNDASGLRTALWRTKQPIMSVTVMFRQPTETSSGRELFRMSE